VTELLGFDTSTVFSDVAEFWDDSKSYVSRPVEWIADKADEWTAAVQQAICESVRDNRYTAVPSCHESGKSWIAARIMAWWIDSHPPGTALVVSTAPTAAQVSTILWQEVTIVHDKAGLDGTITRAGYPRWNIGNLMVGVGRKPADHANSAFQGLHRRYVLVVIDEACGVVRHLYDAIDSLIANVHGRVLAIGNPDDPGAHFATICKPGSDWNVIQIDALRTVNFTKDRVAKYPLTKALMEAERIPYNNEKVPLDLREMFIDPSWVEERIIRWAAVPKGAEKQYDRVELRDTVQRRCATSALFSSKVRGIFPTTSNTGVIPLGWVQLAVNRWHDYQDEMEKAYREGRIHHETRGRRVVGIDVAYGGEDETVVAVRQGNFVNELRRFRNADTVETASIAAQFLNHPGSMAVVDVIGIGAGVFDTLRRWNRDGKITAECIAFNAAAQSHRMDTLGEFKFRNDRAAAWWNFREILDPSRGSLVALPDDERLIEELVAVRYDHLVGGVIKIEDKDEIRKRIARSTDSADAVIQAFWVAGTATTGETAYPWKEARRNDGVARWAGSPMFTEDDLDEMPGRGGFASGSMAPAYGTLAGDDFATNDWDV
jgi:hypothetical protein